MMTLVGRRRRETSIETGPCLVRSWRRSDKVSLVRHANNLNVSRNLRDSFPYPYTMADAEYWLDYARTREPETNFAVDVDGQAVGGIGFTIQQDVYRHTAEVGYWLGEDYWGRGIATAALKAVTEYAFAHHDLLKIYAGVFGWNAGSMRVLQKAGYVQEAVHHKAIIKGGEITDEVVYVRFRPQLREAAA